MNKNRYVAMVIFCLSLIIAYGIYSTEYFIKNDNADIEKNISTFTGNKVNAIIVQKQIVDRDLLVFYGDRKIDGILGFTLLHRGFNGRYEITSTNYGSESHFNIDTYSFKTSKSNYIAIGGRNYDNKIKKYNLMEFDSHKIIINDKSIDGDDFLNVFNLNYEYNFPILQALDGKGNDISKVVTIKEYENIPSSAVGKAELFMLYVWMGIVILVGFIIAKCFWKRRKVIEA